MHADVVLPAISYDIPVGKLVPLELSFAPLGVNFTNQTLPVSNVVGEAVSNVGSLTATIQINGTGTQLVGYSTGQATLKVFQDGTINWYTPGFEVVAATALGVPTPIRLGNTGPQGFLTNLADLGLTASGTSFDTILRGAEDYIHRKLSDRLFKPWTEVMAIIDPGQTDLLVTDQYGHQTGKLSDGILVQQIPGSAYFPDYPLVVIAAPQGGVYKTQVQGRTTGNFLLVTSLSDRSQLLGSQSFSGVIAQGQVIVYSTALDLSSSSLNSTQVSPPVTPQPTSSGFGLGRDAFVSTLYKDLLGRAPEPAGLFFWSKQLASKTKTSSVARSIWFSRERHILLKEHKAPTISFRHAFREASNAWKQAKNVGTAHLAASTITRPSAPRLVTAKH